MSVPASRRAETTMAYIENAERLAAKIFRFTVRLPKRYTWKLGNPLFDHAESVVRLAKRMGGIDLDPVAASLSGYLNHGDADLTWLAEKAMRE